MEQDVDNNYRAVCSTCLSSDRNLFSINNSRDIYQVFRLIMFDFAGDRLGETFQDVELLICWECLAMMKKFLKFKWQVHSAQEHLRVIALSQSQETLDHTYMSVQSMSTLVVETKCDYDKIFFDFSFGTDDAAQFIAITTSDNVKNESYDMVSAVRDNINLDIDEHILEVPEIVLSNSMATVMSHIAVGSEDIMPTVDTYGHPIKTDSPMPHITIGPLTTKDETFILQKPKEEKQEAIPGYKTEYMTAAEMLAYRDELKQKVHYASSVYKCELCIMGFYSQQLIEEHFMSHHRAKPGLVACKICYVYVEESKLGSHTDSHYIRLTCKLCGHTELSRGLMMIHVSSHWEEKSQNNVIKIGDLPQPGIKGKRQKSKDQANKMTAKPGDLRRLLLKTTIEGYQCLECDMFFKTSRARKTHVARYHREGLQCDHCKKRFVNKTTLATHLRLHEGPLPREECPICHKMVRVVQLKYHIQRHQSKGAYECPDCRKVFSHAATYRAHLKYSRAHADERVFKFPCPMCSKGYATKEAMQDHFNYQHLGKTSHKCPICEKPIATRTNVERHLMRVHGEKKEKPRNHVCKVCEKAFTDRKSLSQHEVIHSGDRPLTCDICHQTFKQKASLYTHRKRVHKVFPNKRIVQYMATKSEQNQ